jgi:NAD(P)-dependent dehydrogenase (short-subunit alcohol dehydrogenase family)
VTTDDRTPPPTDPREPQIDIPAQRDDYPGHTEHLEPRPDHGEDSESFEQLTTEQIVRTFSTNVYALLWVSQAALPHLQPGSAIVNSTSIQAYDPSPSLLDYAATKAAIVNLTANLARSLADRGIRVNAVAPGPVWTPLQPPTQPPEKVESFGNTTPLGRPGQPADLAPAYVFLASQDSRYVTGETIAVTGGRLTP